MDIGIVVAILMLVVWGVATFAFEAPGWVHVLLTLGVFLLIYRIVVRVTPATDSLDTSDGAGGGANGGAARGQPRRPR